MSVRYPILFVLLLACFSFSQFVGAQSIVNSFPAPGTNARGLAWDGNYLWCADASDNKVYKLNASNGSILSSFSFNISSNYGGLTWSVTDKIWIGNGLYVYQVNPTTGGTVSSFHCPGG
jgi:hypothetical protein